MTYTLSIRGPVPPTVAGKVVIAHAGAVKKRGLRSPKKGAAGSEKPAAQEVAKHDSQPTNP